MKRTTFFFAFILAALSAFSQNVAPYGGKPGKWVSANGTYSFILDEPLFANPSPAIVGGVELNLPKPERPGYNFRGAKIAGLAIISSASFVDGVLEGYQFDGRRSFERKFGADPEGFWGSQSWRKVYVDGNPEKGFRSKFHKNAGALDFYHVADDFRKWGYLSGGAVFVLGAKGQDWKKCLLDFGIVFVSSSLSKRAGMQWVRN